MKRLQIQANKPAPLFLSYMKPPRPDICQKIAHWIMKTLEKVYSSFGVRNVSLSSCGERTSHFRCSEDSRLEQEIKNNSTIDHQPHLRWPNKVM